MNVKIGRNWTVTASKHCFLYKFYNTHYLFDLVVNTTPSCQVRLGTFCVRDKKEQKRHNPATGEDVMLSTRQAVTFKCSSKLRDRINA